MKKYKKTIAHTLLAILIGIVLELVVFNFQATKANWTATVPSVDFSISISRIVVIPLAYWALKGLFALQNNLYDPGFLEEDEDAP